MDHISVNEGTEADILAEIDAAYEKKKCKRTMSLRLVIGALVGVLVVVVAAFSIYREDIGSNPPTVGGIKPGAITSEGQTVTFTDDFFTTSFTNNSTSSSPSLEEHQNTMISMKFFEDGEQLKFIRDKDETGATGTLSVASTWVGHEFSPGGRASVGGAATIIKSKNGYVSGTVTTVNSNNVYMIWTVDGKQYVKAVDQSKFKEAPDDGVVLAKVDRTPILINNVANEIEEDSGNRLLRRSTTGRSTAAAIFCSDNGDIIDVLVVYTREAACAAAKKESSCNPNDNNIDATIKALIDLAIVQTNQAYSLSFVETELRLVGTMMTEYDYEETDQDDMLDNFVYGQGSTFTKVRDERVRLGADVVHVLVADDKYCGLGVLNSSKAEAFSLSDYTCTTSNYTFGHEIGHNQGCTHDDDTSDSNGYNDPNGAFRTIMASKCKKVSKWRKWFTNYCPVVKRFSKYSRKTSWWKRRTTRRKSFYKGKPFGEEGYSECAKKINERREEMAKFMPCK